MAQLIRVPELGIAIANVTIIEWLVKEGEAVSKGQALLNVETDKMVMEVPAEASGHLLKIFFQVDAQLKIGEPLAIIGQAGENIDSLVAEVQTELRDMSSKLPVPERASVATAAENRPAAPAPLSAYGKVLASPLAKRLARERGIDLFQVSPSGNKQRVTKKDVLRYEEQMRVAAEEPAPLLTTAPPAPVEEADESEIIPLKGVRKVIADRMIGSVHTSAHFTMGIDIDCSRLLVLRGRLKEEFKRVYDLELTYIPFVVKAIAMAVREQPIVNSTLRDDNIIVQKTAQVGVAVASADENFIYVPVIRKPIAKTLLNVTQELAELIQLGRDSKLTPAHTQGGTITLTNIGAELSAYPGLSIINQPEVTSVAMGRIRDKVVPVNGELVIKPILSMTFTYDHRVVMGMPGGRFAEKVKYYLENPELLLAC